MGPSYPTQRWSNNFHKIESPTLLQHIFVYHLFSAQAACNYHFFVAYSCLRFESRVIWKVAGPLFQTATKTTACVLQAICTEPAYPCHLHWPDGRNGNAACAFKHVAEEIARGREARNCMTWLGLQLCNFLLRLHHDSIEKCKVVLSPNRAWIATPFFRRWLRCSNSSPVARWVVCWETTLFGHHALASGWHVGCSSVLVLRLARWQIHETTKKSDVKGSGAHCARIHPSHTHDALGSRA